jgi:RHS repeat-associated protein
MPATERVARVRRRPRRVRPALLQLERRTMLSAGPTEFATLFGQTTGSTSAGHITFVVDPQHFTLPRGGAEIAVSVHPTAGASAAVVTGVVALSGGPIQKLTPMGRSSAVLRLGYGTYALQVSTPGALNSAFEVSTALVGDVNADQRVDARDLALLSQGLVHPKQALAGNPGLDVDGNGVLNRTDYVLAQSNLGAATRITPLTLSAGLDPSVPVDASGSTSQAQVLISGKTEPRALVRLLSTTGAVFQSETADSSGHYAFAALVAVGTTPFTVASSDGFGQSAMRGVSVSRAAPPAPPPVQSGDTQPPTILLGPSLPNSPVNVNPSLSGTVTDTQTGVSTLKVSLDGGAFTTVTLNAGGQFTLTTGLPTGGTADGVHSVRLRATDRAGNIADVFAGTFTLDTTPPSLVLTSPASGASTNTNITVTGQASDALAGLSKVELSLDGGSLAPLTLNATGGFTKSTTLALDGTADGSHTVLVRATDEAGNVKQASVTWTLDTRPPTAPTFGLDPASDSPPVGDSQTYLRPVTLDGTTEPGATVALVGGTQTTTADASGHFALTGVPLLAGANALTVRATDGAGNSSTFSKTITLLPPPTLQPPSIAVSLSDDTAPGGGTNNDHVTSDPSAAGTVTTSQTVTVFRAWLDSAPASSATSVLAKLSGGAFALNGATMAGLAGGHLADGSHTLHLQAGDDFGTLSNVVDLTFILDTTPPSLSLTSPASGALTNTNIMVSGQASDALAGLSKVEMAVDGGSLAPLTVSASGNFTTTTSLALDGTADGSHTVLVRATDLAGNIQTASVTWTLDTRPPTAPTFDLDPASDSPPVGDGQTTIGTVTLDGTTEAGASVALVGGTQTATADSSGHFSLTNVALSPGANVLTVRATDAAGNSSTFTKTITLIAAVDLFTDPNLEAAVRTQLALPSSHLVTKTDLLGLTTLTADSNTISNLTGLQWATNLQSLTLTPSDWSVTGLLTDLSPLSGLSSLTFLSVVKTGITGGSLSALSGLSKLGTLDLRYDPVNSVSAIAGLGSLATLKLYGDPITDLSPLAGKLVNLDLAASNPTAATSVADLAKALHELPLAEYQYVLNTDAYQPYAGGRKGAQAVIETGSGNDWDLDSLLAALLGQAGVSTRYVSGTVNVPTATVMDWLGVTDPQAAGDVLANAGLNPVQILGSGSQSISFHFDHTWLEAQLSVPGAGTEWVDLDPSWKFKDYQPGVANILGLVPFNSADYLSTTRTELTYQYYENQVGAYLAANMPSVSLADVAHDGPIIPQSITTAPSALPYTVVGTTTTATAIPDVLTHRVGLTLSQGGTTLFQEVYELPQVGLSRVTIGFAPASGGLLTPQLLLDGQVAASGSPVVSGSDVTLVIDHYDPGSTGVSDSFTYSRQAGQYIAVGLDAGQLSTAYIARQQAVINAAAIAAKDGQSVSADDQVGAFLALAIATYLKDSDTADSVIDGLTHAVPVFNHVASGLATADNTTVTYHWDLQNPAIPQGCNVDVANSFHQEFALDHNTANDSARQLILGYDGSAEEHAVWENVANTPGISTIKSLQLANQRGIPVFTIDSSNAATLIPQLTIDPSTVASIESEIASGATVTVPRDPTPLNKWNGVGYITRTTTSSGFSEGYIISGGLASQSRVTVQGGSFTGDPNNPSFDPSNNPNDSYTGDPVNIANGDVTSVETDFSLPGIGLPLNFARRYDSQNTVDVGLGVGWVDSYSDHLDFPGGGTVVWTDNVGRRFTFTSNGSGGYVTPAAIYGTLTQNASGYAFRDKNGLVHSFDTSGRLLEIRDRNSNALELAYDGSGHLVSVAEADAPTRQLLFTYNGSHIATVSDGTGRTWTYSYTGNELTEADAPSDAQTPQATVKYAYYTDTALGGLLESVTEPNGGTSTFTYYGDRRAYQVTDPEGFTHTFVYNLYTNVTSFIDERGNVTSYTYDARGEQISVQHPDRAIETTTWTNGLKTADTNVFGQTESFQYDVLGNLTRITDRGGNVRTFTYDPTFSQLTSSTMPGGRVTTYTYDAAGNVLQMIDPMGGITSMTYDAHGLVSSVTTPRGNATVTSGDFTTTYTYNDAGRILTRTTDLPSTETYTYDARGDLTSATDTDSHITQYQYNSLGEMIRSTDPLGGTITFTYDLMGHVASKTDQLGRTTTYAYDPRQHMVRTTDPDGTILVATFDAAGNPITSTDELGRTTTTLYDADGRRAGTINPDGTDSLTIYDGGNRVVAAIDADGNVTRYGYDVLGHVTSITDALNQTAARTYDAVGNLTSATDPLGRTTTYQYDLLNRRTAVTDPLGNTTATAYDADGNVIAVTDPLGHVTRYGYDVRERLVTTTDALNETTTRTYDPVGNLLSITDPAHNTTTYTYDALNRMTTSTDATGATLTRGYDAIGNITSTTDRDGRTRRFTYDLRDHQTSEQWLDASAQPVRTIRYTYDGAGELTSATDPDSSYAYTYDLRGRRTSEDNKGTPGVPNVVFSYTFDGAGDLLTATDTINGVRQGATSYTYDALNRVTRITQTGTGVTDARVDLSYDAASQLTTLTRDADLAGTRTVATTTYSYDADGHVTGMRHAAGATVIAAYAWTFDPAGRVTQETGSDGTSTYTYDATNQLLSATHTTQPAESYTYDANGNRTGSGYVIGPDNRLLSDGRYNYSYDGEGSLVKRVEIATGNITEYSYDYRDRLTSVVFTDSAGHVTQEVDYTYDVSNRRIARSYDPDGPGAQAAQVTRYVNRGENIALQFNGSGTLTDRVLYGPAVDQVLADENATGQLSWFLADRLGSVRNVINSTGAVLDHLVYNSFGQITAESNPANRPEFTFTGRDSDAVTGLQNNRARSYDAATGRFVSQDPLSFAAGDPNLYRYVGNNSVLLIDPRGLSGYNPSGGSHWYDYLPHGIGLQGSGALTGGVVEGAGATGSLGGGFFYDGNQGFNGGTFISGGAFAGGPGDGVSAPNGQNVGTGDFSAGGYVGAGGSGFLTNAQNVQDLSGPFSTWNVDVSLGVQLGSLQVEWGQNAAGQNVWVVSYGPPFAGVGGGADVSSYQTYTQPLTNSLDNQQSAPEDPGPMGPGYVPIGDGLYYFDEGQFFQ